MYWLQVRHSWQTKCTTSLKSLNYPESFFTRLVTEARAMVTARSMSDPKVTKKPHQHGCVRGEPRPDGSCPGSPQQVCTACLALGEVLWMLLLLLPVSYFVSFLNLLNFIYFLSLSPPSSLWERMFHFKGNGCTCLWCSFWTHVLLTDPRVAAAFFYHGTGWQQPRSPATLVGEFYPWWQKFSVFLPTPESLCLNNIWHIVSIQ